MTVACSSNDRARPNPADVARSYVIQAIKLSVYPVKDLEHAKTTIKDVDGNLIGIRGRSL